MNEGAIPVPTAQQKRLFGACVKAILHVHGQGIEKAERSEIEIIEKVRDFLMITVHDISSSREATKKNEWARQILAHLHHELDYSLRETLIRDLADIGVTLGRMLNGKHRSVATKIMDAQMFCDYAANGIHK